MSLNISITYIQARSRTKTHTEITMPRFVHLQLIEKKKTKQERKTNKRTNKNNI